MTRVPSPAAALGLLGLAALSACAAAGGGTSLPWSRGVAVGERADVDSVLAGVDVQWPDGDAAWRAALETTLAECAERRGYRVAGGEAPARWVVTVRPGGGPPGAGELPLDASGYAAALADRVRRASPRAVPPTKATVELAVQKYGAAVWTGEARYDPDPDRPAGGAAAALRQIAAQVPRFGRAPVAARRVAADSAVAFYRESLAGREIACPVVPYPVRFPDLERAYLRGGRHVDWNDTVNAQSHDDATLLPSVLDLVMWADAALPRSIPGYRDLAGADPWREVKLFAELSDADGTPIPLEVTLKGDTRGYTVRESRVLDPAEARERKAEVAAFAQELARWFEQRGR